jgi:2-keto-3-deoxy-L-rhamnonate aldolase RhmA
MDSPVAACRKHGVAAGFLPATAAEKAHWLAKGFRVISLGTDVGVYSRALTEFRQGAG